jgi:hypothetical protein
MMVTKLVIVLIKKIRVDAIAVNGSDIHITSIGENLDLTDLLKIENELEDLLFHYLIALSIYHKLKSKGIIEHIKQYVKELY